MTTKTGPDVLRKLADHYRDVIGWGAADSFKVLAGDWEAERAKMKALEQRDETETMNIGAALFAVVLRDDTGAGEMPAGPCADVLAEWRRLRQAEAALERARALLVKLRDGIDDYWGFCNPEIIADLAALLAAGGEQP